MEYVAMLAFITTCPDAVSLDRPEFEHVFEPGQQRADFLLFNRSTVCEYKTITTMNIAQRVKTLASQSHREPENFKRDFYNGISIALHKANRQIAETKKALKIPEAFGLVMLENLIPNDLSVLALIDAANRKMLGGLESVDVTLCLDLVNSFTNESDGPRRLLQAVVRDNERSNELGILVSRLVRTFVDSTATPLREGFDISAAEQKWFINKEGNYSKFEATFETRRRDKLT